MAETRQQRIGSSADDLTGTTVGRFAVRARLGAGGMGQVYRAEDLTLKRPVALKRMSPELRQDKSYRERFMKEAVRASALNHQHIAAVYDVLESQGELYLVMEYVEGQTLRKRLRQPLTLDQIFGMAVQCAEALAAAHEKGIVHRDIKPENIMLTAEGKVKILDFGVARQLPSLDSEATSDTSFESTAPGISGTPSYMAPEVLMEADADTRADIFSLGVVFYEALTGHHPFREEGFMATCDRILHHTPPPPSQLRAGVPAGLDALVQKMIRKEPAERPANGAQVLAEVRNLRAGTHWGIHWPGLLAGWKLYIGAAVLGLMLLGSFAVPSLKQHVKQWFGMTTVPQAKHLAVLPFRAVGGDEKTVAFCDGLGETLTAKLTQLTQRKTLQVVPAREAHNRNVASVARARQELGVNLVLEGSLHQSGDRVRVTYALVDAGTERQIDAEEFTAPAADPFAVEDRVVTGVLRMLNLELNPGESRALAAHGTQVARAYDLYLQGRGYLQNYDRRENIENAIGVFQRALELDPNYAMARSGLGDAYWFKYEFTHETRWVAPAREACERALELDANLATAHICLGALYDGTGQSEKAVSEFQRAVELQPTADDAHRGLGMAYEHLGRVDDSIKTFERAIALRPHYWGGYNWLGRFYYRQGRFDEAAKMFARVVELAPDSFRGYYNLGAIYLLQGHYSEALLLCEKSVAIRPTGPALSNMATALFYLQRFAEAAQKYEEALKLDEKAYEIWWNLGDAYYWAPGKRAQASGAYRKAIALGEETLQVNPRDAQLLGILAVCHAMLDEKKPAFDQLQRALAIAPGDFELQFKAALVHNHFGETAQALGALEKAAHAGASTFRMRDDPAFQNLRAQSRFQALLRKK